MAAVDHQPCFHTFGQASFSATFAGRADNLYKELETKTAEWEKEREGLLIEVTRLEQRAVQAEALAAANGAHGNLGTLHVCQFCTAYFLTGYKCTYTLSTTQSCGG